MKEPDPAVIGQDGAILNFMGDITDAARNSNGYVLELGCGKGTGSTLAIYRGLKDHRTPLHISVDISDRLEWRPTHGPWCLVIGDTREKETMLEVHEIAEASREDNNPAFAGLIFIDTEHTYDQMKQELALWSALADDDTVWLFHDTHMWGRPNQYGMVRAIEEFAKKNGWTYEDYKTEQHGLGRMVKT